MLASRLLDLLLPECCALCDRDCRRGLCDRCRRSLPVIRDPCDVCGLPAIGHGECRPIAGVNRIVAPFAYEGAVATAMHMLKYGRRRSVARALGLAFVDSGGSRLDDVDELVPVPLHAARLRHRTFNQADELARVIAAGIRRPLSAGSVRRLRNTASQATLPAGERRGNLAGAFAADRRFDDRHVALVDDVVTTGATVAALARVVVGAGAAAVTVLAIARAVRDRQAASAEDLFRPVPPPAS